MPIKQQSQPPKKQEQPEPSPLDAVISKQVLHTLGQPGNLHQVQVRWLWENHYRVNVFVGVGAVGTSAARVANSFFLVADSEGNIIESHPKITRHY